MIDLKESLSDLSYVFQDAIEQNNPFPDENTVLKTKQLLENIYEKFPRRYYLYSDIDGGINIDTNNNDNCNWISIGCYINGNMAITGVIDNVYVSKFYNYIVKEPDEYLCTLLNQVCNNVIEI